MLLRTLFLRRSITTAPLYSKALLPDRSTLVDSFLKALRPRMPATIVIVSHPVTGQWPIISYSTEWTLNHKLVLYKLIDVQRTQLSSQTMSVLNGVKIFWYHGRLGLVLIVRQTCFTVETFHKATCSELGTTAFCKTFARRRRYFRGNSTLSLATLIFVQRTSLQG